jgi:hypothetical protein
VIVVAGVLPEVIGFASPVGKICFGEQKFMVGKAPNYARVKSCFMVKGDVY